MPTAFDDRELLERVDNDLGFLAEAVQMLVDDGPNLLAAVRAAAAAGDAAGVSRSAHALKGMISNFCAAQAQQAALEVERLGKSGDLSSTGPAVDSLTAHLKTLTAELVAFIKERS